MIKSLDIRVKSWSILFAKRDELIIEDGAIEFNGYYYYFYSFDILGSDMKSTWESALAYCQSKNGYLATIDSQTENDFLYNCMKQQGYTDAYFGLSGSAEEGTWEWCDGTPVSYINWHACEPMM